MDSTRSYHLVILLLFALVVGWIAIYSGSPTKPLMAGQAIPERVAQPLVIETPMPAPAPTPEPIPETTEEAPAAPAGDWK